MTNPIQLLLTMPFPESLIEQIREVSPDLKMTQIPAKEAADIPAEVWKEVEILYTNRVLPTAGQAPKLRWIQFHWAGIDALIGAPILRKPDLMATTLSGAGASQIAEYILMMMLALGHRLPDLMRHQQRGEWPADRWDRFTPQELRGSTVGIVGYGSIGRQVARLLQPFGAIVLATKRDAMQVADSGYIPEGQGDPEGKFVRRLYPGQALRSMLKECDFVVVTVPLTEANRSLIGAEELKVLKPTAFLIDVSRGGIIDHQALLAALSRKTIAGAALDVFPEEPLPEESPLWRLPEVFITPHISGITRHYDQRATRLFIANLNRYLAGEPLFNLIDVERGY